jgi:hypothetical protein
MVWRQRMGEPALKPLDCWQALTVLGVKGNTVVRVDVAVEKGCHLGREAEGFVQCRTRKPLSLSRLNHWLPRSQAHPKVMQGTADLHHQITDTLFPETDPVFHDATALHTAVDMLNSQSTLVEPLIRPLLLPRELLATGFLRRHEDRHLRERERQETQIL